MIYSPELQQFDVHGYALVEQCLSIEELTGMRDAIHTLTPPTGAVYAIRHLLDEIPELGTILLGSGLVSLLNHLFGEPWFIVKSMLFDKPPHSDWLVNQHQDAIINTANICDLPGFVAWKKRSWGYSVQPPACYLENIVTIRIHLDECNEMNGALKVKPGTHKRGILRADEIRSMESIPEAVCAVQAGGILLMKPLLVHASAKNTSGRPRRVVHLECTSQKLPPPLQWSEHISLL